MAKEINTIGVLTSGGDAPGMNAAIRAVVRQALSKGKKVKGIKRGYAGLLNEEIVDMDSKSVSDTISRGGTILQTARCKEFVTAEGHQKLTEIFKKHSIDPIVVIGIDKVRDTSTSHERCSIIEVMGRGAGYIALWCGLANGAEEVLLPEKYDNNLEALVERVAHARELGKQHYIIINAEGVGHSQEMAKEIEAATGIETRATILGHMQRGGSPTCKDRVYATIMGAMAVDLLCEGKSNRVVAHKDGNFVDFDIDEALAMKKSVDEYMYDISKSLV